MWVHRAGGRWNSDHQGTQEAGPGLGRLGANRYRAQMGRWGTGVSRRPQGPEAPREETKRNESGLTLPGIGLC